ncbi:MAG: ATP phosphoribosyltransferase regulatory subunit [Rhodospirillales bacterium]|jgi:ATP phosphoribosyltransferase regulatory subunit|nr:ATP phosphoribosyltransferase regulatory subunit [Rhodospirillales bacterium]MDP6773031.1 ATP phosphoribosyltransferase regulatory subunit [Rhodospirillales bacterium]
MSDDSDVALLPTGLSDRLPPDAEFEVRTVERLLASFAQHGYERVKPPLIEFEESLLSGNGAAMSASTFRLMDPISQRMMALRPDLTLQVARIAATRLRNAPRPLRLSYAGQVLRVKGTQLRPERQFGQVGVELVGSSSPDADAEVILMGIEALADIGVENLSVDLGLPTLVPAVSAQLGLDDSASARLRDALDRKDAAAVGAMGRQLGKDAAAMLVAMLDAAGPAEKALQRLERLDLPAEAAGERDILAQVTDLVRAGAPQLKLTIDPVENRGFEYHTGVTFTFFALDVRGELGCGGRYAAGNGGAAQEPATGLSLFMDSVSRSLPTPPPARRIYLPAGTPAKEGSRLHGEGWVTVAGLGHATGATSATDATDATDAADAVAEAARMRCGHAFVDGTIREAAPDKAD